MATNSNGTTAIAGLADADYVTDGLYALMSGLVNQAGGATVLVGPINRAYRSRYPAKYKQVMESKGKDLDDLLATFPVTKQVFSQVLGHKQKEVKFEILDALACYMKMSMGQLLDYCVALGRQRNGVEPAVEIGAYGTALLTLSTTKEEVVRLLEKIESLEGCLGNSDMQINNFAEFISWCRQEYGEKEFLAEIENVRDDDDPSDPKINAKRLNELCEGKGQKASDEEVGLLSDAITNLEDAADIPQAERLMLTEDYLLKLRDGRDRIEIPEIRNHATNGVNGTGKDEGDRPPMI